MVEHIIRAPRGSKISCKGWVQEAALRMLMNNLDPDVAERPKDLVVYGGSGKAARNWESFNNIVNSLRKLESNQTLLIQSGKPVGVLDSHEDAPRVIFSNSMIVPAWANWEHFRHLERLGLTMYGQMTAGSWIYIGTQGILQGTFETFAEAARQHFQSDLKGKWVLTAGLGGMGGAQPLAVTLNGGVCLAVEIDENRIARRVETGYCQKMTKSLDIALDWVNSAVANKEAVSIALCANAVDIYQELVKRKVIPDIVTDQTSAHDPLNGYYPSNFSIEEALKLREENPNEYIKYSMESMAKQVLAMISLKDFGSHVFDYGNNIRAQAHKQGVERAFDFPGFVPAYIRPLFCEGSGPFRWVALSGDPSDIFRTDQALMDAFPNNEKLHHWLKLAKSHVQFQGLPARICWLKYGEREIAGQIFNDLVKSKEVKAPIVIGRDHLDCGSVASPNRETEAMKDGSDAIADWPILNALINSVNGASWVSIHHGGGVGIGYSIHSGMVIVADGTDTAKKRLQRVLRSDPAMGILRHADAGYETAISIAKNKDVKIPGINY